MQEDFPDVLIPQGQTDMTTKARTDKLFDADEHTFEQGPVECLGISFPSDEARRHFFTERLREKLNDPAFRSIEGFPIGENEEILALSDPPYFTACPNPFLGEMIQHYGKLYSPDDKYSCEPFASDVSVGKNDTIYMAHSYHTKVPHQAILRYILHYTKPGDIILDGFCGSGMTGVAASLCADLSSEEKAAIEHEIPGVKWGRRIAVLNDLRPEKPLALCSSRAGLRPDLRG